MRYQLPHPGTLVPRAPEGQAGDQAASRIHVGLVAALCVVAGVGLVAWGWKRQGTQQFLPSLLANLGSAFLLLIPLFILERRLEQGISEVQTQVRELLGIPNEPERQRLRQANGASLLRADQAALALSQLPNGVFGFVAPGEILQLQQGQARLTAKGGGSSVEVQKAKNGQVFLLLYGRPEATKQLSTATAVQQLTLFPRRPAGDSVLVSVHLSRVLAAHHVPFAADPSSPEDVVVLEVLPLSPAGKAPPSEHEQREELRRAHGVAHVTADQAVMPLANLPNGVYGFYVPWLVKDLLDGTARLKSRFGTAELEVHKGKDGNVRLIVFVTPELARQLKTATEPLTAGVLVSKSPQATEAVAVDLGRIVRGHQLFLERDALSLELLPPLASGEAPRTEQQERAALRTEHGVRAIIVDETAPISELPTGVYGFAEARDLQLLRKDAASLHATNYHGDSFEVHKITEEQVRVLAYVTDDEATAIAEATGPVTARLAPGRSLAATRLIALDLARLAAVAHRTDPTDRSCGARIVPPSTSARPYGSSRKQLEALRARHQVTLVAPEHQLLSIGELPQGLYGYTVPWGIDTLQRGGAGLGTSGGTAELEVHKLHGGKVVVVVHADHETAEKLAKATGTTVVRVFTTAQEDTTEVLAIDLDRVLASERGGGGLVLKVGPPPAGADAGPDG